MLIFLELCQFFCFYQYGIYCIRDYLVVYDGSDLSGKVIGNDTGDFNDQEFHSNGTDMFINFISDANSDSVSTGFNASFSIGIYILLYISYLIINKIT